MGKKPKQVVVLPCSGIGKVYGAVARETAYELVEKVRPGLATLTCQPLLVMDVFEHAYMTDYGIKRADYIEAFMKIIDWEEAARRFND